MHHPWREFRALADWTLQSALLPLDFVGITDFDDKTVTLDRRLLQAERRCTIAHEIEHIRRGPVPTDPVLAAREEEQIDTAVARKLISLEQLGEALAWSANMQEAAAELWVDLPTLEARLNHLHPSERHYLRRRLETARHGHDHCHGRRAAAEGSPEQLAVCAGCRYRHECPEAGAADAPSHPGP